MKKYIEIFKYSLKTKIRFLTDYVFSMMAFFVHIFVFNELWDYILQGKLIEGYSKSQLIWYVIIGEFIVYSMSSNYKKIAEMVRNGEISNLLLKPISLTAYWFAEEAGELVKAFVNVILAVLLGIFMAGPIEISILSIVFSVMSASISIFMCMSLQILVGTIAFHTEENRSIWLIVQKIMFFLLFTPLEFYPKIIQKILSVLPTTYIIYSPAKIFVKFEIIEAIILILLQLVSALIIIAGIVFATKKGVKKINVNGG